MYIRKEYASGREGIVAKRTIYLNKRYWHIWLPAITTSGEICTKICIFLCMKPSVLRSRLFHYRSALAVYTISFLSRFHVAMLFFQYIVLLAIVCSHSAFGTLPVMSVVYRCYAITMKIVSRYTNIPLMLLYPFIIMCISLHLSVFRFKSSCLFFGYSSLVPALFQL